MSEHGTVLVDEIPPGYLRTEEAAQRMRLSRRMFELRYKSGDIACPRYKTEGDRAYYFNPADLRLSEQDESADMGLLDTPTAALLAQAYTHNEVLITQTHSMMMQLMAHQAKENETLRNRCHQLEQSHTDLIQAREEALSEEHLRRLAQETADAESKRKDMAIKKLFELAPMMLQTHMAGKLKDKAVSFLDGISVDQINMLLGLNDMADPDDKILTSEQVEFLRQVLITKTPKPEAETTPTEETSE